MRSNYRKIWEAHHNKTIPQGHEIHHIDGDFTNNDPSNLQLVTMEEHLKIHEEQEDWGAVQAILMRMDSPVNISEVAKKAQQDRWSRGTHNFQKMGQDRRLEVSSHAGMYTRDHKLGIHAINSDPEKARENGRRGGLKAKEKNAGFLNVQSDKHGSKAVKGTFWWVNADGIKKRSKECPGEGWIKGTIYKETL
jgi:general stress protein YciG